jgi:hypothetical protein
VELEKTPPLITKKRTKVIVGFSQEMLNKAK